MSMEETKGEKIEKIPEVVVNKPNKIFLQKPIRTYESDVAEAMARGKSSIVTMVVAEQEKKQEEKKQEIKKIVVPIVKEDIQKEDIAREIQYKKSNSKKILVALLSIVFIGGGLGGGYYLYLQSPVAPVEILPQKISIPSLVPVDSQNNLSIGNRDGQDLALFLNNELNLYSIPPDKIFELILNENVGSTTVRITASKFIDEINFRVPDILKRALKDRWVIGGNEIDGQKISFLVFSTDFFQNAFAGMLKWEPTMPEELSSLFGYTDRFSRGIFEDKVIKNRDVREFVSDRGETLLLYSFIDKDTIIITTSEASLGLLIDRIERQSYLR